MRPERTLLLLGALCAACASTPEASPAAASAPSTGAAGETAVQPSARGAAAQASREALRARANDVLDGQLFAQAPAERAEALAALGLSRREDALGQLSQALGEEKGELRFAAAQGLAALGDKGAAAALAKAWRRETGWGVRKELASAAGPCGCLELTADLKVALNDPNPELQLAAAFALQDLGDAAGAAALARLGNPARKGTFKEGSDRWARKVLTGKKEGDRLLAIKTLARFGAPDDVALLEQQLGGEDSTARVWAAASILRLTR